MSESELNPFQSPQTLRSSESPFPQKPKLLGAVGIYRDAHYLVIDRRSHVFPPVCVITSLPTKNYYLFDERVSHQRMRQLPVVGGVISGILDAVLKLDSDRKSSQTQVRIPVISTRAVDKQRSLAGPILLILIGVFFLSLGTLSIFLSAGEDAILLLFLGGIITLLGFSSGVTYFTRAPGPFKGIHANETHLWIEGAHLDYLDSLEDIPADVPSRMTGW